MKKQQTLCQKSYINADSCLMSILFWFLVEIGEYFVVHSSNFQYCFFSHFLNVGCQDELQVISLLYDVEGNQVFLPLSDFYVQSLNNNVVNKNNSEILLFISENMWSTNAILTRIIANNEWSFSGWSFSMVSILAIPSWHWILMLLFHILVYAASAL